MYIKKYKEFNEGLMDVLQSMSSKNKLVKNLQYRYLSRHLKSNQYYIRLGSADLYCDQKFNIMMGNFLKEKSLIDVKKFSSRMDWVGTKLTLYLKNVFKSEGFTCFKYYLTAALSKIEEDRVEDIYIDIFGTMEQLLPIVKYYGMLDNVIKPSWLNTYLHKHRELPLDLKSGSNLGD